jgi:phosphatidate cytidylyltransferase
VTDDTRDGDDLFEDLDKFFAPIKDVDWEEPSEPSGERTTQEEHVAVHVSQRIADEPVPAERSADSPQGAGTQDRDLGVDPAQGGEDDDTEDEDEDAEGQDAAWYDTGVMDTIEDIDDLDEDQGEIGGDEDRAEPSESGDDVGEVDLVRIVDEGAVRLADEASIEADEAQADLFAEAQADVSLDPEEPSEEELEAATEHFADSARVMPFGEEDDAAFDTGARGEPGSDDDESGPFGGSEPRTVTVGSSGLGGPSWQEPASIEVGADLERHGPRGEERDVPAAFVTGIVLALVALVSLWIDKAAFAFVATLVALWAQGELYGVMVRQRRHQPATAVGLASGALIMGGAYFHGEPAMLAMFALGVVATFLWFMSVPGAHRRNTIENIGLTLLDVAWIPLLAGFLLVTLTLNDGVGLVVAVIGLTFVFDTSAFLVGQVWGGSLFHESLAPSTSPRKSVEGTIGATLITVIVGAALVPAFVDAFQNKRVDALLLALVVAAAATFGDLAESLIKRDLEIKDMGNVLPGHGGILDRIDSLLFVAPASFLLFRIVLG